MKNQVDLNTLKQLTIGEIRDLEKIQSSVQDIIDRANEKIDFIEEQTKTGKFAEDLMNEI